MFERLTNRFQDVFKTLAGRGRLTEANISDAMAEVRRALLEADVNYQVVKDFVAELRQKCLGDRVMRSVTPGQQAIRVVHDELEALLGEATAPLDLNANPAVVMLVGLHGSGKTTTAAKLAMHLRDRQGRTPMLAACDLHRPAAIEQLEMLGEELGLRVYVDRNAQDVARLAVDARNEAANQGCDVLILDTAGRLQVDTDLVDELIRVRRRAQPREILLVADAALGQEAVSVAEHFDEALGITGIILTKLDGDARGGAALSMRRVTGKPIKFVGVGERAVDLEPFHPDRMTSRILGMGDVVSLVEKASEQYEEEEAKKLEQKLRKSTFDFEDFRDQLGRIQKMGGFLSLLDMVPGISQFKDKLSVDESQFKRIEGIICSMTLFERQRPEAINLSRRQRIAAGSGVELVQVNQLIKQFEMMRKTIGQLGKGGGGLPPGMQDLLGGGGPGGIPMGHGGGMPLFGGGGHGVTKAKKKERKKRQKTIGKKKKRKR